MPKIISKSENWRGILCHLEPRSQLRACMKRFATRDNPLGPVHEPPSTETDVI